VWAVVWAVASEYLHQNPISSHVTAVRVTDCLPSRTDPTLSPSLSCLDLDLEVIKHGDSTSQHSESVSTVDDYVPRHVVANDQTQACT